MRVEGPQQTRVVNPTVRWLRAQLADVESEWTLNWGSTRGLEGKVIQKPRAVRLCSDKWKAKDRLWWAGVPTPTVYTVEVAKAIVSGNHPVVGRPAQHSQGRDFHICRTPLGVDRATAAGCTHFTSLIEAPQEFRVHVIKDRVVKISEKVGGEGIIRSYRNGWRFHVPTIPKRDRGPLRDAAKAAVRTLGLDLGAADILYREGEVWVTEVNAAPSLTDPHSNTGEKYVRWIKEVWA